MIDQNDALRLKALVQEMNEILSKQDTQQPVPGPVEQPAKAITHVILESLSDKPQESVPFTFGQVFAVGDFKPDSGLAGRFDNGDTIPLQVDVKALQADGSVRHAIISGIGGALFGKEQRKMELIPAKPLTGEPVVPSKVPNGAVRLKLDGVEYTTNAALLSNPMQWLLGPEVGELRARVKLTDSKGKEHPHLTVRVGYRLYRSKQVRLEILVENVWAYESNPQNFTYDVVIEIEGKNVYEQKALTHFHHARWRKVFWIGEQPQVNVRHDAEYLIGTLALPNYDTSLVIPEKTIEEWDTKWKKAGDAPMSVGLSVKGMATTGGRPDIGILPQWSVLALLTGDKRLLDATNGTADLAGSWSIHYRDKNTDRPVSLIDYPYMTILGRAGDTKNPNKVDPATNKKGFYEAFPTLVKGQDKSPYQHDSAHQPGFSYLSYVLTGDYYHLEELQFWAMWNVFSSNPGYRKNVQGLLWRQQVRGIAWSFRTLAQAAYITPDNDRLKGHFKQVLKSNIDYGIATFVKPETANKIGIFTGPGSIVYKSGTAIGTFQDEHLTSAIAYVVDLGFADAEPLLEWKAKFAIERLTGEGTNWLAAVNYTWPVKESQESPEFTSIDEAYKKLIKDADKATLDRLNSGGTDLGGYPTSTEGFPANLQPAAAAAARYNWKAWEQFEKRSPKPNYGTGPQFAILPRTV